MMLLDTHVFLWYVLADPGLSESALCKIQTSDRVFVSIASFWEMAIKSSLGKLKLPVSVSELMELCVSGGFEILQIRPAHLQTLEELPWIHRDPFDRLIVAQARAEGLELATEDSYVRRYDVKTAEL
ncbi:MAG: type II toxin-antitoxin system VapC family toxin [Clostridia bacterium]|nr:type II toxin-antitoxin system VapC family toxin [Clostridia bacterium]